MVKGRLNQKQTKKRNVSSGDYNDKFFTYICLIFLSSMFLFFDKFMFEEKKVRTVTTYNALHAVYNIFSHESLFAAKNCLTL